MKISTLTITPVDEFHAMVKSTLACTLQKDGCCGFMGGISCHLFLPIINSQIRIFAYITGDEQGIMREQGLL